MLTSLSDPSPTLYAVLAILAAILGGLWVRSRSRGDLIRFAIGLAALVIVFLIDRFVESPREQASRKIEEIAKATQEKKWDEMFKHFSPSFKYKTLGSVEIDRKAIEGPIRLVEGQTDFKGIAVWDLHRADFRPIDDKNISIGFRAQVRDMPVSQSWIIATFTKDPDGEWRMSGFTRYDFAKQDRSAPIGIPGID